MPRAGSIDRPFRLLEPLLDQQRDGFPLESTDKDLGIVWGRFMDQAGTERVEGQQRTSRVNTTIRMRWDANLKPTMKLRDEESEITYEITTVAVVKRNEEVDVGAYVLNGRTSEV